MSAPSAAIVRFAERLVAFTRPSDPFLLEAPVTAQRSDTNGGAMVAGDGLEFVEFASRDAMTVDRSESHACTSNRQRG
jgi:hypothetical protein